MSSNPAIKSLPKELGRLSQCNSLNIQGTGIPGGEVSPSAVGKKSDPEQNVYYVFISINCMDLFCQATFMFLI